jgi:hypothetical protein
LRKVVRVDDESEKVDGAVLLHEQISNLKLRARILGWGVGGEGWVFID